MQVAQGEFLLQRLPAIKNDVLRGWDAADEYILNQLAEDFGCLKNLNILVINDNFGALSIPLTVENKVTVWSDSFLTEQAIITNFKNNKIEPVGYHFVKSTDTPEGNFDIVVMKVPKSHAYLQDQLIRLASVLDEKTVFIAAAMVKNIHTSTLKIVENIFPDSRTSLAKKKARLIYINTKNIIATAINPYPKNYPLESKNYQLLNYSNVFSREKLDIGSRFFMQHIPADSDYKRIVDMGCGNGLIGLLAAEKNPQAEIIFTDESYMAVQSATENMQASGLNNKVLFLETDCLQGIENNSAELVLNNPPFHQQHATGINIALRMFRDAKRVLKKNGELWVIGNRHLGYHSHLKKIFGHCDLVASNKKFVILLARK